MRSSFPHSALDTGDEFAIAVGIPKPAFRLGFSNRATFSAHCRYLPSVVEVLPRFQTIMCLVLVSIAMLLVVHRPTCNLR